jgi:hypothetical protein
VNRNAARAERLELTASDSVAPPSRVVLESASARMFFQKRAAPCFDACGSARMRLLCGCNSLHCAVLVRIERQAGHAVHSCCRACCCRQWRWMRCKLVMSGVRPTGVPHRVHHRAGLGLLRLHGRQARPFPRERGLVQVLQEDRHRQPVCTQVPRVCFCLWMRASAPVHVRTRRQAGCHIVAMRRLEAAPYAPFPSPPARLHAYI